MVPPRRARRRELAWSLLCTAVHGRVAHIRVMTQQTALWSQLPRQGWWVYRGVTKVVQMQPLCARELWRLRPGGVPAEVRALRCRGARWGRAVARHRAAAGGRRVVKLLLCGPLVAAAKAGRVSRGRTRWKQGLHAWAAAWRVAVMGSMGVRVGRDGRQCGRRGCGAQGLCTATVVWLQSMHLGWRRARTRVRCLFLGSSLAEAIKPSDPHCRRM